MLADAIVPTPVLWDVIDEHLDEAAFLTTAWERQLDSPEVGLARLAGGVERRMLAHVEALTIGGPRVASKALLPALKGDDLDHVYAAALALLRGGRDEDTAAVLAAWRSAPPAPRRRIRRALELGPEGALDTLISDLPALASGRRAEALDILGFHRIRPATDLDAFASLAEESERAALLRVSARCRVNALGGLAAEYLDATDAELCAAALVAGAVLGVPEHQAACISAATRDDLAGATALLLLALQPDAAALAVLLAASNRPAGLFALGFSGAPAAAQYCVNMLQEGRHLPLAFEALRGLTGATLPEAEPPANDDDDSDEDISPPCPEAELPLPDVRAVVAWWADHGRDATRPLHDPGELLGALMRAPMRRRHALALHLMVRTGGHAQLETRALAVRQTIQMRQLASTLRR